MQYQINRNEQGWVIEPVHNGGVTKHPTRPAAGIEETIACNLQQTRSLKAPPVLFLPTRLQWPEMPCKQCSNRANVPGQTKDS